MAGGVLGMARPAWAETSSHTFSGTVKSSVAGGGAKHYTFNCAEGAPGFVEGVGENRTLARVTGKREAGVVHFQIAQNTEPYAFLSRVVTSLTLRVEAPVAFSPHTYSITLYCTSNVRDAWRVLG
jgi:hypothetical protein